MEPMCIRISERFLQKEDLRGDTHIKARDQGPYRVVRTKPAAVELVVTCRISLIISDPARRQSEGEAPIRGVVLREYLRPY